MGHTALDATCQGDLRICAAQFLPESLAGNGRAGIFLAVAQDAARVQIPVGAQHGWFPVWSLATAPGELR